MCCFIIVVLLFVAVDHCHASTPEFSLLFDGTTNMAILPYQPEYSVSSHSIEAWIRPNVQQTDPFQAIFVQPASSIGPTGNWVIGLWYGWPSSIRMVCGGGYSYGCTPLPESLLNDWFHVAYTLDTETNYITCYANGVQLQHRFVDNPGVIPVSTVDFSIGGYLGCYYPECPYGAGTFHGGIDNIRFWNLVRTDQQIMQSYNDKLSGKEIGLIGYWVLANGPSSNIIYDYQLTLPTQTFAAETGNTTGVYATSTSDPPACNKPGCGIPS